MRLRTHDYFFFSFFLFPLTAQVYNVRPDENFNPPVRLHVAKFHRIFYRIFLFFFLFYDLAHFHEIAQFDNSNLSSD